MPTTVGLNKGATAANGGKGPATDYSMLLEMKRRAIIVKGQMVKNGVKISDRPMTRGFEEGPVTARLHLNGAFKNFVKF
jgi:hypothetical protein